MCSDLHIQNKLLIRWSISLCSGYIDLSKRRVLPEDVEKCEERYNQAKAVRHPSFITLSLSHTQTGRRRGCSFIPAREGTGLNLVHMLVCLS